jgi:hypothetical protein
MTEETTCTLVKVLGVLAALDISVVPEDGVVAGSAAVVVVLSGTMMREVVDSVGVLTGVLTELSGGT